MFDIRMISKRSLIGSVLGLLLGLCLSLVGTPAKLVTVASASATEPRLTLVADSSWPAAEKAKVQEWDSPEGTVQKTVREVVGPTKEPITVTVSKETLHAAGDYTPSYKQIRLTELRLAVLVHEENHATRDYTMQFGCSVWEEGLARAGEKEVMRLLAKKGIFEAGYDLNHGYGYEVFYDNDNLPGIGTSNCSIYQEEAMVLERYEQAGYAFSKILMENPLFIRQLDAKLFALGSGYLSSAELMAIAKEVQPTVEGQPIDKWFKAQHIFDTEVVEGCRMSARASQYTIDYYCVDAYGDQTPQASASITCTVKAVVGGKLYKAKVVTEGLGWITLSPEVPPNAGRLQITCKTKSPEGKTIKLVFYRQAGAEEGLFGVVLKANSGTVTISSPTGQFPTVTEPVVNGEYAAPGFEKVRGQAVLTFSGEGKTGVRTVNKDEAPYSVIIEAKKAKAPKGERKLNPLNKRSAGTPSGSRRSSFLGKNPRVQSS